MATHQEESVKRDQQLCWRRGGQATLVHNRSYALEVLAGDNDAQLASPFEGCHTVIHYDKSGAKRAPEETDRLLFVKCGATDIPAQSNGHQSQLVEN